ncbi:MAG: single-stranded-DNA-specific exonuclease RecJ, partial [Rhodospirillales bacterium]|nr:single-stranded-DNA-specific exonuclease RecJ [Rhodospirillales bacterium]
LRYLKAVGGQASSYIPDRLKEGYGPNAGAMVSIKNGGADLVVTVDCGTTSFEPLQAAHDTGLDVIVVDHHEAEANLPVAIAVVNPKRLDEVDNPYSHLAAVGITFLLVVAINRTLRAQRWFAGDENNRKEPDLLSLLDLVALGTVCDVVPLTGLNRAFVHQGLKVMAARGNTGINALADVAGVDEAPGAYHAGFILGPRVNAGGRVGESGLGTRLLTTDDRVMADEIANHLDALNQERQAIEKSILEQAIAQVEEQQSRTNAAVVIASGEGWHPGVIGIVASRLKDRYNRPSCVIALSEDGIATGSGRSISGIDLGRAIIAARQAGHLIKGGGHAMAAGFTLETEKLGDLRAFLEERIGDQIAAQNIEPVLNVDGAVRAAGANMELLEALDQVGPYGAGNPEPRFAIAEARITYADVIGAGGDHVKCRIEDASGGPALNAIAFRCMETGLGEALLKNSRAGGAPLHIAGKLRINTWQGRSTPQMIIDDVATVW